MCRSLARTHRAWSSVCSALTLLLTGAGAVEANPVLWDAAAGGNGHAYEYVASTLSWDQAVTAAEGMTFQGVPGQLVTITSQAENDFIYTALGIANMSFPQGFPWLGGYQLQGSVEPEGGWQWITSEPWSFTNWSTFEPNDTGGIEHVLQMSNDSLWNDADGSRLFPFVVEYDLSGTPTSTPTPTPPPAPFEPPAGGQPPPPPSPTPSPLPTPGPPGTAELTLQVGTPTGWVSAGGSLEYSFEVFNAGPEDATNVTLDASLDRALSFESGQGCLASGQSVSCDLGTIPGSPGPVPAAGATAGGTILARVSPEAAGSVTTSFALSADQIDPSPGNATATVVTALAPAVPALPPVALLLLVVLVTALGVIRTGTR